MPAHECVCVFMPTDTRRECSCDHEDCSVWRHIELSSVLWAPEYFTVRMHHWIEAAPGSKQFIVMQSDILLLFISLIE